MDTVACGSPLNEAPGATAGLSSSARVVVDTAAVRFGPRWLEWLLGEPPSARQPLPLVALVRALCPAEVETCDGLPATPQSAWLAERLPLASEPNEGSARSSVARVPQ